jgi:uncharacterized hydantoinase/oxoprolinase family protein
VLLHSWKTTDNDFEIMSQKARKDFERICYEEIMTVGIDRLNVSSILCNVYLHQNITWYPYMYV